MVNVLLVTVDSLRADHVGCYGYERPTTPRIDALSEKSMWFTNTFAHACSTRPSFPTILTSSYPLMYGGYERISENRTLVSEVFDDADYRTGGFHSNAYLNPEFGYGRGFDDFFDSMTDPSAVARLRQWAKNQLDDDGLLYNTLASMFDTAERRAGANIGSAYVNADEITDNAIQWLRDGEGEDEFLWVHYMDVHHPYLPPDEHQLNFRDDPIGNRRAIQLRRKFIEDPDNVTDEELNDIIDLYDAEIRFTDTEIGRLLDEVDDQWEDYIVAFTSDHGEEFREHGGFSHHPNFYDEVLHVPLMIYDEEHSGQYDELVGLIDLSPTLVDFAGLNQPDNFYGNSLTELIQGNWNREAILGDWSPNSQDDGERRYAYRDDRWKFIQRESGEELYDLEEDPNEKDNVLDQYPDVVVELRDELSAHEEEIEATWEDLGEVHMDEDVKARLRDLGYKE